MAYFVDLNRITSEWQWLKHSDEEVVFISIIVYLSIFHDVIGACNYLLSVSDGSDISDINIIPIEHSSDFFRHEKALIIFCYF